MARVMATDPADPTPALTGAVVAPSVQRPVDDVSITNNDVLFGRGGRTNHHPGNLRYRDIISLHRPDYVGAQKQDKPKVARRIVRAIKSGDKPGRFLKRG